MLEVLNLLTKSKYTDMRSFGAINLTTVGLSNGVFTFDGTAKAYYVNPSIPAGLTIKANTDFNIEVDITTSLTTNQMILGDLHNTIGTGTWWLMINNTFQTTAMITLDMQGQPGATAKRFRFGIGATKFATNTKKRLRVKRVAGVITASLDGVAFPESYTDQFGPTNYPSYYMTFGGTSDGLLLFKGTLGNWVAKFS